MSFLDIRLPETYSKGSLFGPGFKTEIIELDSGAEQRTHLTPDTGRRVFNLSKGLQTIDDLVTVQRFHIVVQGSTYSFRVKDWSDYSTNATGTHHRTGDVSVSSTDVVLQMIDTLNYQFVKNYTYGATTRTRALTKLVSGTPTVSIDDVTQVSGFSVNLLTGICTFASDPGGVVKGGTQYDVEARFEKDTGERLQIAIQAIDSGDMPEINAVEVVDAVLFNQNVDFGGDKNHGSMGGSDIAMVELDGRVQIFEPAIGGLAAILPDTALLPTGGPYFMIYNGSGSQTLEVKDFVGTVLEAALPTSTGMEIWLGTDNVGVKTWYGA